MNILLDTVLVVVPGMVLAPVGVYFARRVFKPEHLSEYHHIAGYLLAVVGTLYGILLGMLVVNVIAKFDQARLMADMEANACSDIWHLAKAFPEEPRSIIRKRLVRYYTVVQNQNWEAVRDDPEREESTGPYQGLWGALMNYQPQTNHETACYSSALTSVKGLSDARRFRILSSKRAVSPIVWTVLITGGVLIILFTFFFAVRSVVVQMVLVSFVALFISLNLLLVKLFDNPYRQEFRVKEGAFSLKPEQLGEYNSKPGRPSPTGEADEDTGPVKHD